VTAPRVDVVIAVHSVTRPIERAVASVLDASPSGRSRALVVAHGLSADDIASRLPDAPGDRVVVWGFDDGIRSPAGPFNAGLARADAEFVAVMGSDDTLQPGAIDAALRRAREDAADVVILPLRSADGVLVRAPLPRRGRTRRLDAVRDRLFTRTAPLAVMRRELVTGLAPVFDPAYRTGEDLEFGARLWSASQPSYHPADPGYVVGADAVDRVTAATTDLVTVLAAPRALATRSWVEELSPRERRALAIKVLRVHVLGAVQLRAADPTPIAPDEAEALTATVRGWLGLAPRALAPFSRADRAALEAIRERPGDLADIAAARARASRAARLLPRNPLRVLDGESTVRRYLLYRTAGEGASS